MLYGGKDLRRFGRKEFARLVSILPQTRDVPSIRAEQLVAHGRYPHLSFGRDLTQADREKIAWAMEVTGTTALKDFPRTRTSSFWTSPPPTWTSAKSTRCWS